jgi:hypothetical protein
VSSDAAAGSDEGVGARVDELAEAVSGTGSSSDKGVGMGTSGDLAETFNSSDPGAGSDGAALIVYAGVEFHTGSETSLTTSTRCATFATKPLTWGVSGRSTTWFKRRRPRLRTTSDWERSKPIPLRTHLT